MCTWSPYRNCRKYLNFPDTGYVCTDPPEPLRLLPSRLIASESVDWHFLSWVLIVEDVLHLVGPCSPFSYSSQLSQSCSQTKLVLHGIAVYIIIPTSLPETWTHRGGNPWSLADLPADLTDPQPGDVSLQGDEPLHWSVGPSDHRSITASPYNPVSCLHLLQPCHYNSPSSTELFVSSCFTQHSPDGLNEWEQKSIVCSLQ